MLVITKFTWYKANLLYNHLLRKEQLPACKITNSHLKAKSSFMITINKGNNLMQRAKSYIKYFGNRSIKRDIKKL